MRALRFLGPMMLWSSLVCAARVEGQAAPDAAPPPPTTESSNPSTTTSDSGPSAGAEAVSTAGGELSPAETLARLRALEAKIAELTAAQEAQAAATPPPELTALDPDISPDLLRIYGYFDTGLQYQHFAHPDSFNRAFGRTDGFTYQFGGLNLYFDAQPHEQFRALVETRISLWPQGNETSFDLPGDPSVRYQRTDTSLYDTSSTTGRNKIAWNGLMLERAWGQWQPRDWFNVRAGLLLTPYGIWNIDHGAPTLISLVLPDFFAAEYFPTRQIGIEILGNITHNRWELGYHFTMSNGRNFALTDVNNNKAFGGRVYARFNNKFTIGGSWYWDKFEDIKKEIRTFVPFSLNRLTWYRGKEYSLGLDVSADVGDFRIRAEGVMNHIQYDDGYHKPTGNSPGATQPNEYRWDGYVLAAYTKPEWFIEPYVLAEAFRKLNPLTDADGVIQASVGVNLLFTPRVSLKNQFSAFQFIDFANDWNRSDRDTFYNLISRLVLAF